MQKQVFAAVLAGGRSRRFGADKAMADLAGAPMIVRVGERLRAQADRLAIVGHTEGAEALGCAALADPDVLTEGPLLGILAALEWAGAGGARWLVSAPCDTPLIPEDMAARLIADAERADADAAFVETADGVHPLCAVWSPRLAPVLRAHLEAGRHPPVVQAAAHTAHVLFKDAGAFANINTPDDFARISASGKV